MFNSDHHTSNRIYWTTNALTGEPEPITKEGSLDLGNQITTDMVNFIKSGSEFGKRYGEQGQGGGRMPGFGAMLTDEQINAIIDYVRGL